jgi:uncharacterized membrane protein
MRGFAVLCMIEHHTFDAMLVSSFHGSTLDRFFRFVGGIAAPSFLFLAGLAAAFAMERKPETVPRMFKRAGMVFLGAYLFRFQEWALAFGGSPWTDMLRIDILNCIGVALVIVVGAFALRARFLAFLILAAAVVAVSPLVRAADLSHWPNHLAGYLNGSSPGALFPLFPWMAHAFAGAALGVLLARVPRDQEPVFFTMISVVALLVWFATRFIDGLPFGVYPGMDWWQTSPAYFILRNCSSVWILATFWLLDRALPATSRDPLLKLGQHSLIVYWVHIEIVYGRWLWRLRGTMQPVQGVAVLALVIAAMIGLSYLIEWRPRPRVQVSPT